MAAESAKPGFPPKDCKACKGVSDLFEAFSKRGGKFSKPDQDQRRSDQQRQADPVLDSSSEAAPSGSASGPCPPGTAEIGRAAWIFLHTTAAYYPDTPSTSQQSLMRSMVDALAEFYPCHYCAEHLREQVKASPPRVGSAVELSAWMCKIHNEVGAYCPTTVWPVPVPTTVCLHVLFGM